MNTTMKNKLTSNLVKLAIVTSIFGAVALTNAKTAHGHGYVESPMSRSYTASQMSSQMGWNAAYQFYGSIINEPQSVEGTGSVSMSGDHSWWDTRRVADGTFASGGLAQFNQLNTITNWQSTEIRTGINEFTWYFTAAHATNHFKYYMTREEWDPNRPLTELTAADLELIEFIDYNRMTGEQLGTRRTHEVNIPDNRSGNHIVLALWDVSDTHNAFYQAIDVYVENNGLQVPETPEVSELNIAHGIEWVTRQDDNKNLTGQLSVEVDRDFQDRHGRSVINLLLRGEDNRPLDLTNYEIIFSTEGVLGNTTTTPEWQERGHVHLPILNAGETTVSLQHKETQEIDEFLTFVVTTEGEIEAPEIPETPSAYPQWSAIASYTIGDRVVFEGRVWQARQTFRGWGDLGWAPNLTRSLWSLVNE